MSSRRSVVKRRGRLAALFVPLLLVASACGGSSDGGSGSGPQVKGPSGDPIRLGSIAAASGPNASTNGLHEQVVNAWVDQTNADGGINGHRVEVTHIDDANDSAKSLQAAKRLVEQEKVQAIISMQTTSPGAAKYLAEKDVPIIGPTDQTGGAFSLPNYFTTGTGLKTGTAALLNIAKNSDRKKFGSFYCSEAPGCAGQDALLKKASPLFGLGYDSWAISQSAPDYTAQCLAAKKSGVDAMLLAVGGPVIPKIVSQCKAQGYEPQIIEISAAVSSALLKESSLEGLTMWSGLANYQNETVPGAKAFSAAMQKYAPDALNSDEFNPYYVNVWAAGQLYKAAAEAGKLGPESTPADVKKGLYMLKDETADGLIPPTTWVEGKYIEPTCYFEIKMEGGKFTGGDKPICVEQSVIDSYS